LHSLRHDRRDAACGERPQAGGIAFRRCVHGPGGREFKRHPIVGLEPSALAESGQLVGSARKQRNQHERRGAQRDPHIGQQCRHRSLSGSLGELWQARLDAFGCGANQEQVGFAHQPHRPVREDRREGVDDRSQVLLCDLVGVSPLAEHAAGLQSRARGLEKLARKERRDAGHPGIGRLRDDDIVLAGRESQVRAAVGDEESYGWVLQHSPVLAFKIRRCFDHFR
jgi:hypothetical protein